MKHDKTLGVLRLELLGLYVGTQDYEDLGIFWLWEVVEPMKRSMKVLETL